MRRALVVIVLLVCGVSFAPAPAKAIAILDDLLLAGAVAGINRNMSKPTVESSVLLDVTAEMRWGVHVIGTAFPLTGGTPLYVLKGTEVDLYLTLIKSKTNEKEGVKKVEVTCSHEGLDITPSPSMIRIRTDRISSSGAFPLSIMAEFPNGRKYSFPFHHGSDKSDSQQSFFRLIVLDHDAVERALNDPEVAQAVGYLGGTAVSPLVPVLPGAGPRYRISDEIAARFLNNVPGTIPAGVNPVGAVPTQIPPEPPVPDAWAPPPPAGRAERESCQAETETGDDGSLSRVLTDATERSMVEQYTRNLAGRTFDLSGVVYGRSAMREYPQCMVVVIHNRFGRLVKGVPNIFGLLGGNVPEPVDEVAPGGVLAPNYSAAATEQKIWLGDDCRQAPGGQPTIVVHLRGAGSFVFVPVLWDSSDGRFYVGGQPCPAVVR